MSAPGPWDDERRVRASAAEILGASGAVRVVERTTSTQDLARGLAREGLPAIVLARHQTAARGRLGRPWFDAPGMGVACSIALSRDSVDLDELPARVGVAACLAIESFAPRADPALKWPNDVVVGRAGDSPQVPGLGKLAGVLVEVKEDLAIVGVGINVLQREFPPQIARSSASLAMLGVEVQPIDACEALLRAFAAVLGWPWGEVLAAWRCRDALLGRRIRLHLPDRMVEGVVEGIEPAREIALRERDGGITRADTRTARIDEILD